jgi:hypothetical protein
LRFSLPASVFFPGFALFCLWFSGPIPLCSASQFLPVLPLSFLPILPSVRLRCSKSSSVPGLFSSAPPLCSCFQCSFPPLFPPCLCSALPFIEPEHAEKTRSSVHQSMSRIMGKKSWCRGPRFAAYFLLNRLHPLKRGRR